MLEQKWQNSLFATQKQENDWVYTPNQGALRCVRPAPLSRLAGYALAVWFFRVVGGRCVKYIPRVPHMGFLIRLLQMWFVSPVPLGCARSTTGPLLNARCGPVC
jgi:hypothetical protein